MEERQKGILALTAEITEKLETIEEKLIKVLLDAENYKTDRKWIIAVFGTLWGATLVYMEWKLKT